MKPQFRCLLIILTFSFGCSESEPTTEVTSDASMDAGGDAGPGVVTERPAAVFEPEAVPTETALGLIPFPNALYLNADGQVDLRGFPNQNQGSIIARTVDALKLHVDGFGTTATMYLGLDGPVATNTLPATAADSLSEDSALFIVNVEPGSPAFGERLPLNWQQQEDANLYLPAHTLKIRLVEGMSLRAHQHYALCLTSAAAKPAPTFVELMNSERPQGVLGAAWDAYAVLRAWASDRSPDLATCGLFRTQDPVGELFAARDFMHTLPIPEVRDLESLGGRIGIFELLVGKYTAPRFQQGELPYLAPGSGGFRFDDDGNLIIQGYEDLRFALSIPLEYDMPPDGWPVVLYGHGTGGDYQSFIDAKVAVTLARAGIAVLSIDQIHHGFRDPRPDGCRTQGDPSACVSLVFFNFLIPEAGRDNVRQSALDFVSLLRMAQNFDEELPVRGTERPEDRPERIETDAGSAPSAAVDSGLMLVDEADMSPPADSMDAGIGLDANPMPEQEDAGPRPPDSDPSPNPEMDFGIGSPADAGLTDAIPVVELDATIDLEQSDAAMDMNDDMGTSEAPELPPRQWRRIKLDPNRIVYMGHSQGGLNGPLFLAVEPLVKAGVLSAAGGTISITLEQKTKPSDINALVASFVPVSDDKEVDRWHPATALLQTFIESGDPTNYARHWFHEVRPDAPPRHIFMTAGLSDQYTPPDSIFALAAAGRVPVIEPVHRPIELFDVYDIQPAGIPPYSNNVAAGTASAGMVQLRDYGHFVIQNNITIRNRYKQFIDSVFRGEASIY